MPFEFIADRPVLDFLPTMAARGSVDEEKLRTPDDLAAWVVESGLLDAAPPLTADDVLRARALREACYGVVCALVGHRAPSTADREQVNAAAVPAPPALRLAPDGSLHRTGDVDAVLAALARDCLDLCASPDREVLHFCADPICTRAFVDRSRGARRRWCGMKGCGDRAKAAAYRRRQRLGAGAEPDGSLSDAGR